MGIKIPGEITYWPGTTEEEETDRYYPHPAPHPPTLIVKGERSQIEIPIPQEKFEGFREQFYYYLVQEGALDCPECGETLDYEIGGDPSVGIEHYIAIWCPNDDCIYADMDSREKEEEMINKLFPPYWRWEEEG